MLFLFVLASLSAWRWHKNPLPMLEMQKTWALLILERDAGRYSCHANTLLHRLYRNGEMGNAARC